MDMLLKASRQMVGKNEGEEWHIWRITSITICSLVCLITHSNVYLTFENLCLQTYWHKYLNLCKYWPTNFAQLYYWSWLYSWDRYSTIFLHYHHPQSFEDFVCIIKLCEIISKSKFNVIKKHNFFIFKSTLFTILILTKRFL